MPVASMLAYLSGGMTIENMPEQYSKKIVSGQAVGISFPGEANGSSAYVWAAGGSCFFEVRRPH